jgi:glutathione S-transferase
MSDTPEYTPPKVWLAKPALGRFANINRPTAGAQFERELPIGKHPLQLYSLGTPNGVKVTIMLEELLALGHKGAEYDAWLIKIGDGDQFGSGFVAVNPNSKIPALMDRSGPKPIRVFETGAILVYLAEKFGAFLPTEVAARAECLSWLFWQMGSTPYVGGGFGHFYAYAPVKIEYAIDRFTMETKRLLDVLDRLHDRRHGDLSLVRRAGEVRPVRRDRVPCGPRVQERPALGRRAARTAAREARAHGQPPSGRTVEPVARAPRRQRLRDEDAGQARRGLSTGSLGATPIAVLRLLKHRSSRR